VQESSESVGGELLEAEGYYSTDNYTDLIKFGVNVGGGNGSNSCRIEVKTGAAELLRVC